MTGQFNAGGGIITIVQRIVDGLEVLGVMSHTPHFADFLKFNIVLSRACRAFGRAPRCTS